MSNPGMKGFGAGYRNAKSRMPDLLYQGGGQAKSGSNHEKCRESIESWKEYAGNLEERIDEFTDESFAYREFVASATEHGPMKLPQKDGGHIELSEEEVMDWVSDQKDKNQEMRERGNPVEERKDF